MSDAITGVVRVVHMLSAVTWVGGAFLWGMLIAPRVLARGPPAIRRPFAEAVIPAMTRFFMIAGVLTLLSGIVLVGMIFGWGDYFDAFEGANGYGVALTLGALAGIAMAIVGFGMSAPTGAKMLRAMQGVQGPPTEAQQAQMAALGKKLGILGMTTILLGTIAVIGMAWAVNVAR